MKVLLETRCGCRREVEWSEFGGEIEKPTKHINVPLMPGFPFSFDGRSWYRKFTMVGMENHALRYLEMRISPVWTEDELRNNSGPPDIVFDSSLEDKK
jgi:hypothetical protein